MTDFVSWLEDWQTLVAGILAVVAAAVGAFLLWRQTAQTKETAEDDRKRGLDKARALAQFELSRLTDAINLYVREIDFILRNRRRMSTLSFQEWPRTALEALSNIQMHCTPTERQQFGELFRNMQVLQARLDSCTERSFSNTLLPTHSWLLNACMLAQVKSAVDSLFPYCRFEQDDFPRMDQYLPSIENTFSFWGLDLDGDPDHPRSDVSYVRRWLSRTYKEAPKPWPIRVPIPR